MITDRNEKVGQDESRKVFPSRVKVTYFFYDQSITNDKNLSLNLYPCVSLRKHAYQTFPSFSVSAFSPSFTVSRYLRFSKTLGINGRDSLTLKRSLLKVNLFFFQIKCPCGVLELRSSSLPDLQHLRPFA